MDLTEKVGFDVRGKAFHRSLRHELNEKGVSLSYAIWKKIAPTSLTSLQDELQYRLPLKMSNAKFRRDSQKVFTKVEGVVKLT